MPNKFSDDGFLTKNMGTKQDRLEQGPTEKGIADITDSPGIDDREIQLESIVDVEKLQAIMKNFCSFAKIALVLRDLKGEVIIASGWRDVCTKFHGVHPSTRSNCVESHLFPSKNINPGECVDYICKYGFRNAVTPLYIGGHLVGNIYAGQFFYDDEPIDEDYFIKQAGRYGFDQNDYITAVRRMPRHSRETIGRILNFLVQFTEYISINTATNLRLKKEICERKQSESACKDNEVRLRTLIHAIPDLVWMKDQNGSYLFCNARFESFFGEKEADIIGKSDYDFMSRELADFFREHDRIAVERGEATINEEEITFAADGHREILETIKTPVFRSDDQLLGVLGVARDITQRKIAEEKIRYHEMLLEEMGRIAKIGGWEFDPETGKGTWTAEVARMHDLDPEDPTTVDLGLSFFQGANRVSIENAIKNAIDRGLSWDLELELLSAKNVRKWVHTRGQPIFSAGKVVNVRGSIQDITDRKRFENEYIENAERLRLALQASRMGTWEWDIDVNRVIWSPETLRIFGVEAGAFGGTYEAYLGFAHPLVRDRVAAQVADFLRKAPEQEIIQYDHEIIRGDGKPGWIEVRGTVTTSQNGQPCRMTGICTDITERKKTDLELQKYRDELEDMVRERTAQLEAANKELEAFSYSVSHDLRAPLRAIDGYSRVLLEDYGAHLDDEGHRFCKVISDSARDMGKLIDDLLAFSRIGRASIKPSPVDMATLARSVYYEVTTRQERERIDFHVAPIPQAVVDPSMVRHIWMNLLSNAVKFSSKKARTNIEINGEQLADQVNYSVKDNGAGFDMQYSHKLFGVFQRLHSAKDFYGTGVGLAIVQRIVHRHGGRVWAHGVVDKGAIFHFSLPGKPTVTRQTKPGNQCLKES